MKNFIKQIIREAGYLAKDYYHKGVEQGFKSDPTDIVTVADREVEKFLVEKIQEKYPEHGIISEEREGEINPGAEYTWVIDPIDGTRNFAKHIAVWCTMIGLAKNGQPYMGAVYDALNDELFFGEIGKGAFCNDKKIKVSNQENIQYCFIVYSGGVVSDGPYNAQNFVGYKKFYQNLVYDCGHWVHQYGTALSICHLATGRVDATMFNAGLYHDYLPGYVIATEAGAKFTDSDGNDWKRGRKDIVVANPKLHQKLLKLFKYE
jgi:myo-inositol-1(or 4)-monophosphatase